MLEPILVVSFRKVLARMRTTTFRAANRRMKADTRLGEHIVEFERLGEIRVEDHRIIGDAEIIAHHPNDAVELAQPLVEQRAVAKDRTVTLHRLLHGQPDCAGAGLALRPPDPVEPGDGAIDRLVGRRVSYPAGSPAG